MAWCLWWRVSARRASPTCARWKNIGKNLVKLGQERATRETTLWRLKTIFSHPAVPCPLIYICDRALEYRFQKPYRPVQAKLAPPIHHMRLRAGNRPSARGAQAPLARVAGVCGLTGPLHGARWASERLCVSRHRPPGNHPPRGPAGLARPGSIERHPVRATRGMRHHGRPAQPAQLRPPPFFLSFAFSFLSL
jgi:hypothetical protein